MKVTFDLPESLIQEVKLRAVREGKRFKDTFAELLEAGLADPRPAEPMRIVREGRTGFPVVCCHPAKPGQEATPERIHEILAEEEARAVVGAS